MSEQALKASDQGGTEDTAGLRGVVLVEVHGPDGELKHREQIDNLITDSGDTYYVVRGVSAVSPAAPSDATKVTGMKLGTGTTAAAKNGAGAAMVTYISGSNVAFDSSFPTGATLGAGLGAQATYQCTWGAGTATNAAITEAVIVDDSGTDATSTSGHTISRVVFTATPKGSLDTLTISWSHKLLGS